MRLGAQMSTAGGLEQAFVRGAEVGCETIMVFTKSNRQWEARPLEPQSISGFLAATARFAEIRPAVAHASYLINLASHDKELWARSVEALKDECLRAAALGIPFVTFHPGAAVDGKVQQGLKRIAKGLTRILEETEDEAPYTTICLETMAGQGNQLGHRFEHLADIIEMAGSPGRLGVCLDSCHIFAAGYDIRTPEAYEETMEELQRLVGLERVRCFHLNDSQHPLGARKDRHAHIGEGEIGLEAFRLLVNDQRWKFHPAHIETPKSKTSKESGETIDMDAINLQTLSNLIAPES